MIFNSIYSKTQLLTNIFNNFTSVNYFKYKKIYLYKVLLFFINFLVYLIRVKIIILTIIYAKIETKNKKSKNIYFS